MKSDFPYTKEKASQVRAEFVSRSNYNALRLLGKSFELSRALKTFESKNIFIFT